MKALLIGLGFFSQNCHLKLLKKNRSIKKIYVFDEREQLTKNIANPATATYEPIEEI